MGYTTEFSGVFLFDKKLDEDTHKFLEKLAYTRRMKRNVDENIYGVEGEFYVDGKGFAGQEHEDNIVDYNNPPGEQPSLWLQWIPTEDGCGLMWDGGEKFYAYVPWLKYLIKKIFKPRGYVLNGDVKWRGEDFDDIGTICVKDNKVTVKYEWD